MTKLLSRKPVFEAKMFVVNEDKIELQTGSKRTYYNVIRKSAVSVFPIDDDYNLYLIDQDRYLIERRVLEAVAGIIDEGEKPIDAAKRELKEETGIVAREVESLGSYISAPSIVTWEQPLFIARDLQFGEQELEESEDIRLVKVSLDEAVQKVLNGEINTSATCIGVLKIDKLRQEGKI